jgi:ABC-type branched-subunit amino acid transport system substrate-binding protein
MPGARLWSVLALAACAVTSVGCEPEDPPEDPTSIAVGALLPFTGELSAYGAAYERALILAVERVNEAGGVSGHKLRLVSKDTHSNVERGLESARALFDAGVVNVIGPEEPEVTLGMASMVSAFDGLQILPSISSPRSAGRTVSADWFHIAPSPRLLGCMLGTRLYQDKRARVVIVNENDPFLFAVASSVSRNYNALLKPGVDSQRSTATLLPYQPGQKSYADLIGSVTRRQADSLVLLGYPESAAKIVAGWDVGGNDAPMYLSPTLQSRAFQLNCPQGALEGSLGIGVDLGNDHDSFAKQFAARWGGEKPMPMAYFYYDALVLWALAREAATAQAHREPSSAAIKTQLVKVSKAGPNVVNWNEVEKGLKLAAAGAGIDYRGASGVLDLGDDGELVKGSSATFWNIQGEEIVAEAAAACAVANP